MKKYILLIAALFAICLNGNAQFSFSVNAGWDFPRVHHYDNESVSGSFTIGGDVYYGLNPYLNLRLGLRYHYVGEKGYPDLYGGIIPLESLHLSSLEVPLLINFRTQKEIKHWTTVWGAGLFGGVPVEKSRGKRDEKIRPYGGVMVSGQLEILYHYFVRAEYQWYLSNDLKTDYNEDDKHRRVARISVVCGYRF